MAARKYNPGFLSDEEIVASFCVRTSEFESIVEMLRDCRESSNPHQIVIGPRGSGKTNLLLRIAAEIRRDASLSSHFFPVVFAEESYEVSTAGEFWLECLSCLAVQAPGMESGPDLGRSYEELRVISDDRTLGERCLGAALDFSDRETKRLALIVENLNTLFRDMTDPDAGWRLRKVLQTEPRIILLGSATCRFDQIDHPDQALYDLFRVTSLRPLGTDECATLWRTVSGREVRQETIRSLRILTGGNPRLVMIVARFGASLSFRALMSELLDLVDDHTEYFRSHLEMLPAQERRVYLALADLWKPATAREIADRARLETSKCSAQLTRLSERAIVEVTGGTARRKQYYLTERMYNIYYLLRRPRGPHRMVESLVRFMESFYSPLEMRDIGCSIARESQHVERSLVDRADFELSCGRNKSASEMAGLALDRCLPDSVESRLRAYIIRAKAQLADGDTEGSEPDITSALTVLAKVETVPREHLRALIEFSVQLGPRRLRELVEASPSAPLLLSLTTALAQEEGLQPRVAREVEEVAADIRKELKTIREGKALQTASDGDANQTVNTARTSGIVIRDKLHRALPIRHGPIRLAVVGTAKEKSNSWKIWMENDGEVCFAIREPNPGFKVGLHKSGKQHIKMASEYWGRWREPDIYAGPMVGTSAKLLFPTWGMREDDKLSAQEREDWKGNEMEIDAPVEGKLLAVSVVVRAEGQVSKQEGGGSETLARWRRPDGKEAHLIVSEEAERNFRDIVLKALANEDFLQALREAAESGGDVLDGKTALTATLAGPANEGGNYFLCVSTTIGTREGERGKEYVPMVAGLSSSPA